MSLDTALSRTDPDAGFGAFRLSPALTAVLARQGVTVPTPIQAATLPDALAGRDVLGRGPTGSGKTYAFLLPLVAALSGRGRAAARRPRALVLAPTRELATQINQALAPLAAAAGLRSITVFGGVGQQPQVTALARGVDVVVACPGRLLDLVQQGHLDLSVIEVTVLDEADHMADLGFLPAVRRILDATPSTGQRLLFSATLDAGVAVLVKRYLNHPVEHRTQPAAADHSVTVHHVLHVRSEDRLPVLMELTGGTEPVVVFTRTKHGAKKLAKQLNAGGVPTVELQGNLSQSARASNMQRFHSGAATTLVATDIAARGIHVDNVAIVVHADPPTEHKAYVHRSGRTARAGADGTVVTLATSEQLAVVRDLTRRAKVQATVTDVQPGHPLLGQLTGGSRRAPSAADASRAPRVSSASRAPSTLRAPSSSAPRSAERHRARPARTRRRSQRPSVEVGRR